MRALPLLAVVAALGCAACLSGPDGVARSWPPPLAKVDVAAIATGDLDGDGTADVIVLVAGTEATGAGVYFAKGGVDVDASASAPIKSFTSYTPLADVEAPAAGAVIANGNTTAALFLYGKSGALQLAAFDGAALGALGEHATGLTVTSTSHVWLRLIGFPGNTTRLVVGDDTDVVHTDPTTLTSSALQFNMMPAPNGGTWTNAEVAATYTSGSDTIVAIGERVDVQRSTIPTSPPPQGSFSWSTVRSGAAWIGQTAIDLGNGRDDLVGFATGSPGQLCAIDPGGTGMGTCVSSNLMASSDVTVLAGKLKSGDQSPSVVVVQGGSGNASVEIHPGATFDGTTLGGPPAVAPAMTSIANARPALYSNGVLLVGENGAATCVGLGAGGTGACD